MGIKCRSFTDPDKNFIKYGHQPLGTDRSGQARMLFGMFWPGLARKLGLRQISGEVSNFFHRVILQTRDSRKKNNIERKDFLQLVMDLQDKHEDGPALNDHDIVALCFGLFIGGFETSSSTMTFCLYELARSQEIQDKVREEVNTVLKKHDGIMTFESISEMKYMQQVLDETWRRYTPVHTMNRVCTKDYKIPGEDLIIEKGTNVLITLLGIHRDPEYYERPLEFYPEHFSDENRRKRPPYAHIPFGAGPRMCVGERFGIMQIKACLASMIKKYKVTLDKRTPQPLVMKVTPMIPVPDSGVWLNFEKLS